ncbi:PTS sugar transporter subunit IIC [Cytobacillus sp. S13-E01]|uniref:PTS transporter subunit IIC n=1 Tax=Cytobacillus sp. S13-E01 TaxID=3031326 RepID=UPI0023D88817|nr:PTS sugar transporter subunit IIC [Cytobacillus sp. S13-E01]MDF0726463.1 PTS sugar transporter subunit IIC [Cytobacillus sp. S13-E01]
MRDFLLRKGVTLSPKVYFIEALSYMALGLFSSLIIGLIIKTVGEQIGTPLSPLFIEMGTMAMSLYGPAIGAAVAYGLKAPPLVLFSALLSGAAGASLGGPAGSFIAALISTEIGKLVSKETKIDIIITPFVTIVSGFLTATFIGPSINLFMKSFGEIIMWSTEQRPIVMGILVAVLMGLALTAPISSAAIALMLDLQGLAAGAATIGCCAQMMGFATSSFRENRYGGFIAQGLGTSMLQVANIIKNPLILIPPTVAGAILAPLGTVVFKLTNNAAGAGMGTSGLVGQIMTFTSNGFTLGIFLSVLLLHFIGPALISLVLSEVMRKKGWIKFGDMKINTGG